MSIPGEERHFIRFYTESVAFHLIPLTMENAAECELIHHEFLLVRRGIG